LAGRGRVGFPLGQPRCCRFVRRCLGFPAIYSGDVKSVNRQLAFHQNWVNCLGVANLAMKHLFGRGPGRLPTNRTDRKSKLPAPAPIGWSAVPDLIPCLLSGFFGNCDDSTVRGGIVGWSWRRTPWTARLRV